MSLSFVFVAVVCSQYRKYLESYWTEGYSNSVNRVAGSGACERLDGPGWTDAERADFTGGRLPSRGVFAPSTLAVTSPGGRVTTYDAVRRYLASWIVVQAAPKTLRKMKYESTTGLRQHATFSYCKGRSLRLKVKGFIWTTQADCSNDVGWYMLQIYTDLQHNIS